jgi:signal transduction histidine kinase
MLSIVVEDNGKGMGENQQNGMGLKGIEARVQSLHGHLSINTGQEHGTSVYIELETHYLQNANNDAYAYNSNDHG